MSDHEHDWRPVLTWSGRYRCQGCQCFGYRRVVLPTEINRATGHQITPYRCAVKGCGGWAVMKMPGRMVGTKAGWRCAAHRPH